MFKFKSSSCLALDISLCLKKKKDYSRSILFIYKENYPETLLMIWKHRLKVEEGSMAMKLIGICEFGWQIKKNNIFFSFAECIEG